MALDESKKIRSEGVAAAGFGLQIEDHPAWPMISQLPVSLSVSIPMNSFKVRGLLALTTGQTIESAWPAREDVPLNIGGLRMGWGEFEIVDQGMAVRLTRLA